jgi:hypothetical protein
MVEPSEWRGLQLDQDSAIVDRDDDRRTYPDNPAPAKE